MFNENKVSTTRVDGGPGLYRIANPKKTGFTSKKLTPFLQTKFSNVVLVVDQVFDTRRSEGACDILPEYSIYPETFGSTKAYRSR